MILLHQSLAQECPAPKSPENLSLYLLCNTIRFSTYKQENISSYIKSMNLVTPLIYTKQLDQ